jgi:hypothetical protein
MGRAQDSTPQGQEKMTELEMLQIVGRVMSDRSLPNRARVRVSRMRELGLPDDANVARLASMWLEKRMNEVYIRDNSAGTSKG